MERKLHRRRHYIIKKAFQLKYIALLLAVVLISVIITGYTIYYNIWTLLGDKLANVYPQGRLITIFRTVNVRLAINMIFVSMLCIGIGIFASHRIAGPVFRMIRFLNTVAAGDYNQKLTLRKTDELKDLAEAINKVVDRLKVESEKKS